MERICDAIVINIFTIILLLVLSYFFKEALSRIILERMRQREKELSLINEVENNFYENQLLDILKDNLCKDYRLILCEKNDNLEGDLDALKNDLMYLTEAQLDPNHINNILESAYVDKLSGMMIKIFKEYDQRQGKNKAIFDANKKEIHQKVMLFFNSLKAGSYDKDKINVFKNMG